MFLYYIRHGDPIYNPDSLTPLGERQAEALGRRLALSGIDEIYSSTSERAKLTAKPLSEILKLEIKELDWANEKYAAPEFYTTKEDGTRGTWCFWDEETRKVFMSEEVRKLGREWYRHPFFKDDRYGEGICRIQKEADAFLESLGYKHDLEKNCYEELFESNKKVALFAHQGFGMAFLSCILDIPYPYYSTHFDITTTGVTVIDFSKWREPVIPAVMTHSDVSHLYGERIPLRYNSRGHI